MRQVPAYHKLATVGAEKCNCMNGACHPADSTTAFVHVMKVAKKIARAGMKAFEADGVTVQQFSEPAGGQVVFHLHVHVMPRKEGMNAAAGLRQVGVCYDISLRS